MNYALAGNIVAILHISTIIAVVLGLLVSFRHKRFRPWEAGVLISIVILWSYYGNCPFTIMEQHFRTLAGQEVNLTSIGFLPYYAYKFLDIELTSRTVQNSTFLFGGILFTASIDWFAPFLHMEIFKLRKWLKKIFRRPHLVKTKRT